MSQAGASGGPLSLQEALAIVASTPAVAAVILQGLPSFALEPSGDVWGARQVLEHLIDVEGIAFTERIGRIVDEDNPFIRSIDPPARLVQGGYSSESLPNLLERFAELRMQNITWVQGLPPESLERTGTHDRAGEISAGGLVHYWACHDLLHLRQLLSALQSHMAPHIGNMHRFLEGG